MIQGTIASRRCEELADNMKPIKIVLAGCEVELQPRAYMINFGGYCVLGIERMPAD